MRDATMSRGVRGGAAALALAGLLALPGCDEQIMLTDAALDPSDQCSQYRGTISAARRTEVQEQAEAAVAGALFGAVLGAVVADATGGDRAQGALMGAAAGGLTGLSATYYEQQRARAADAATLLSLVNADAGRERALVTQTGAAALALRECRSAQVASVTQRVQAGQVERDAARRELAVIQSNLAADNQVISAAFNGIGERVDAYIDASAATAQLDRALVVADSAPAAAQSVRSATPSVREVARARRAVVDQDAVAASEIARDIEAAQILLG